MGTEWVFVIFLIIVLFFGKNRLPDMARSIGKAVGEYNSTKKRIEYEVKKTYGHANVDVKGPVQTEREKMEMIARSVGVENAPNKTDQELRQLISSRIGTQTKQDSETKLQKQESINDHKTDNTNNNGSMKRDASSSKQEKENHHNSTAMTGDSIQVDNSQNLVKHKDGVKGDEITAKGQDFQNKNGKEYLKRQYAGIM